MRTWARMPKLAATWAKGDMGLMVGILVGALTLGSSLPQLLSAIGPPAWTGVLAVAALLFSALGAFAACAT